MSYAENDDKPAPQVEKTEDGLLKTQKRLDALIKAAIAHDVVNSGKKKPQRKNTKKLKIQHGDSTHKSTPAPVENSPVNTCVSKEIFAFPQDVFVADYQSLILLKNKILIGPNEIDKHKVRLLVLAYIGLGFGEEAQDYSAYLDGVEKQVLVAMGRSVTGIVQAKDIDVLMDQNKCSDQAGLWSSFASIQYLGGGETLSTEQKNHVLTPDQLAQIEALPKKLKSIMAKRFGIYAVKHDAMNTAAILLQSLAGDDEETSTAAMLDDEIRFFKAQFYLRKQDPRAYTILKSLAKKDGPMRVRALQDLSAIQTKTGAIAYPEFVVDLDGAAHVFSQHPEGKLALVEKIKYFVATDNIDQAIGMTKEKFSIEEDFYTANVLRVSERMQLHLTGQDEKLKLHALNTLLREQIFFNSLVDGFPLRRDGISASLDLGLSELAPRILPVKQWGRLELHVLQELALSLPDEMKANLPQKAFSGAGHDLAKIKTAFNDAKPKQAMALLRGMPENEGAVIIAASKSWEKGYWALAKDTHDTLAKTQTENGQEISPSLESKKNLAAVLSVSSPYLSGRKNLAGNAGDLSAFQTFLDEDLNIIKDYVNHE